MTIRLQLTERNTTTLTKNEITKKTRAFFQAIPEVNFAYLFGSLVEGKMTPLSDVDVAIYLTKERESDWRFRISLLGRLSDELQSDRVDLVILNHGSILLKHQILKTGELLFCRNPEQHLAFFQQTIKEYCDTAHLREFHISAAKKRAQQGVKRGSSRSFANALERVRRLFGEA